MKEETRTDDENDDGDASAPALELSDLERNLARIRVMLEQKYSNDRDSCFSYVCPNGFKLRLTPFMMREWSLAIVSVLA
jgi:hypothetical protein